MTTTAASAQSVGNGPWSPLRIKVYRSLWIAGLVSNIGTFTHLLGAGWSMRRGRLPDSFSRYMRGRSPIGLIVGA